MYLETIYTTHSYVCAASMHASVCIIKHLRELGRGRGRRRRRARARNMCRNRFFGKRVLGARARTQQARSYRTRRNQIVREYNVPAAFSCRFSVDDLRAVD